MLDLMVEYWLDRFDESPLEVHRNADGFIQLKDTGDPLIDKWEEKIAQGDEPDLWEAFSPEAREQLNRARARASKIQAQGGYTIADAMERVGREARAQGLDDPSRHTQRPYRLDTFGDGTD